MKHMEESKLNSEKIEIWKKGKLNMKRYGK